MPAALTASSEKEEVISKRPKWEVADIFRLYGKEYRSNHATPLSHRKVMHSIEVCRTSYLGGHVERCDSCGYEHYAYNSCRNRHCPKCQSLTKARWLQDRKAELLPVGYFHAVFTLPHELNPLALCNKKTIFDILFKSVSETLLQFGINNLGGKMGFLCILHTWDQTLLDHIHLHCVIPGGALSSDKTKWLPARENYLFNVIALSQVFRGKFTELLKRAFTHNEFAFEGIASVLAAEKDFFRFIDGLKQKGWVVYCKEPFAGPEHVLEYIGRYTHRVAISNNRIVRVENREVTFTYRDRRQGDVPKRMTLHAREFIRRFLLHVLPEGFVRIRHFGFMSNRCKKQDIQQIRELTDASDCVMEKTEKNTQELMLELTGMDITICPCCKSGSMKVISLIAPMWDSVREYMDSS